MDELEFYKNKSTRLESALKKIVSKEWRSYDVMIGIANFALEEESRIEKEMSGIEIDRQEA